MYVTEAYLIFLTWKAFSNWRSNVEILEVQKYAVFVFLYAESLLEK